MSKLNRRDFLKLAGLLPLGLSTSHVPAAPSDRPNILIVVFDAWSAYNLPLYGYGRATTPNLERLSRGAIVYHNHHAGSSFTTPGTATLLTGTLPWTHRAMESKGTVIEPYVSRNLFSALLGYYHIAYTHNGWANILLEQLRDSLEELVPWKSLFLNSFDKFIPALFEKDSDIATVGWTRTVDVATEGWSYSLLFSRIYNALLQRRYEGLLKDFPRGLPSTGNIGSEFLLEEGIDWVAKRLAEVPQPFLGYFHFLPPHGPYNTSLQFYDRFAGDGFQPPDKPEDVFTRKFTRAALLKRRREYDEFILYVDDQFSRFMQKLEDSGILENTWVILTSDHGEMNERGISGHSTDALFQPVLRVPLVIFEPGRTERLDIHDPTSAVDLLPTAAHLAGAAEPDWGEGRVLPPFREPPAGGRSIFAVKADKNDKSAPLEHASLMMLRDNWKLLYAYGIHGAPEGGLVRLFDLSRDPEEMDDLAGAKKDVAAGLLEELKAKVREVDKPYI